MKTLIAYYSRTGLTRKVAFKLATEYGATMEEIRDKADRSGIWGYLKSGKEAIQKKNTDLHHFKNNPADFDLVIVGTPTWAFSVSSPVRTFLAEHKASLKKVAWFSTLGGDGPSKVFTQMSEITGLTPIATLTVKSKEAFQDKYQEKLAKFIDELKK